MDHGTIAAHPVLRILQLYIRVDCYVVYHGLKINTDIYIYKAIMN